MKVFITGGTGFLGKHLQAEFSKYSEIEILIPSSKECNLLNYKNISFFIYNNKPDVILHAAALCGGIKANSENPASFLVDNLLMGINIFEAARNANIKSVYTLGSVCAYPVNCPAPFSEDDLWNGYPESTNAPYGHAKRTLLILGNTYRQQHQINGAHLIPVNLMGEYDNFNLQSSHVIPALIRKFYEAKLNNEPNVKCWGTGMATREFLYAGDAAEAIALSIKNGLNTDLPINLGMGSDISIYDLAHLISALIDYKGEILFTGEVSDGQPKRMLNCSRAEELIGFKAKTSLKDGLIKTIEYYKNNREAILLKDPK